MRDIFSRITIFVGNYGSGKTEISLNIALERARAGRDVTVIDLDIVNPYFRLSERAEALEAAGVRVLVPTFSNTTVDIPVVPAQMHGALDGDGDIIIDVGGDDAGSVALGQFNKKLSGLGYDLIYVVNPCRPMSRDENMIADLLRRIEARSRLKVTGLLHNANLARETTAELIEQTYGITAAASRLTGIEVRGVVSMPEYIPQLPEEMRKIAMPIDIKMRPEWLD